MQLPTLSVVIPNYNHAAYLPACLNSLLEQSVPPDEILVVDDASTDNSAQVVTEFARRHPRIQLLRNPENLGAVPTINRGVQAARSECVYGAGADDFVLPGFIEKSLQLLARHPQAALACTISEWRDEVHKLNPHIGARMPTTPGYLDPDALVRLEQRGRLQIPSNAVIYRRDGLLRVGLFRPELRWHCDWFAIHALAFRSGLCFVPESLAVFFIRSGGYSVKDPRQAETRRELFRAMLNTLNLPEFDDVARRIQSSGALYLFGIPMLKLILTQPEYRAYRSGLYLRKALWYSFKMRVRLLVPPALGELYYRLSGNRAKRS